MEEKLHIIDGCTAAAHVAYALSDVATVYPITPVASMGETAQKWAMDGRRNVFGRPLDVVEMESELGAAGATHGALSAGSLACTFTSSQGLLLMIPNMFKISGELLPGVFHVGCRSIATHALSIFGDHQDVMAARSTGFAFLMSASVQEAMDLGLVSHLAAIEGSLPVVHMFDGWRTSNEMSTVSVIGYDDIASLVEHDKVAAFRARGMNPEHPQIRGTAQNADVYFQNREASNRFYDSFPDVVRRQMKRVGDLTGRHYGLFDYVGAADADRVMVIMGSGCEVAEEAVRYLNSLGGTYRTGVVKVRLFRPFDAAAMLDVIPPTVKTVAVMDRTKEPGAQGEPLYQDVVTALHTAGRCVKVIGGRYGLSSKDFTPSMVKAVFDIMPESVSGRQFTVGINDDVTGLSIPVTDEIVTAPESMKQFMFYGIGSDGTVGATKQAASILSDLSGCYVQASFDYSAKKSGGYTVSSLRLDKNPVRTEYNIQQADYVACNKDSYVRRFSMADVLKENGVFVLNSPWTLADMEREFPARLKRLLCNRKIRFYNVDAASIAEKNGLGVRINTIMETVFLKLSAVVDFDRAVSALKEIVSRTYNHDGSVMVERNIDAIDQAFDAIQSIEIPPSWALATDEPVADTDSDMPDFVKNVAGPCLRREGDALPVSAFRADGFTPMGTTAYEKRSIALKVPEWDREKCIQCTLCSMVCAHAAIRPVVLTQEEADAGPAGMSSKPAAGPENMSDYRYRIQVYAQDCVGCGSCAVVCPAHALTMVSPVTQLPAQIANLRYVQTKVTEKENLLPRFSFRGSQLRQPLLEFSGACGGCGETPYIKLLTQLFGERMVVANATGCSSIWGADFPSMPYCVNSRGHGPALGNSLFEDNAEYGYGIALGIRHRRERLADLLTDMRDKSSSPELVKAIDLWLSGKDDAEQSVAAAETLRPLLPVGSEAAALSDLLVKKSVWAIGGDGWAYDIGFAGLDHVIAQDVDINILVMDTQCYSNTGGQQSKATPLGAVVKYAPDGKRTDRKDLGRMAMTYGHVYVASVSLGANPAKTIEILREAEEYPGPSLIIAYCPCINHGIRAGMSHAIVEEREAVRCGYWPLYHYNPLADPKLSVDYFTPNGNLVEFINGENRYADLNMIDPDAAAGLQTRLADDARELFRILKSNGE